MNKDQLVEIEPWQQALRNNLTKTEELLEILNLTPKPSLSDDLKHFPLRVPRAFVSRMEKGNWQDPLLLQVLPQAREWGYYPGYCQDPLQESQANPVPGLLHKYRGRVLITLSGACAIHCRYCFRRHFPYEENTPGLKGWAPMFDYLDRDSSIKEVILSGGDPLLLKDEILSRFVSELTRIPHLKRLRVHTRVPVVIPERVTDQMVEWLTQTRLTPVVVMHINHANEIDEAVMAVCHYLVKQGVTVLNQTVLLKGVNDHGQVLIALSERLWEARILPYYLHLLDRVQGAAHFEVSESDARVWVQEMMQFLPGFLVPRLVKEVPGMASKVPVAVF